MKIRGPIILLPVFLSGCFTNLNHLGEAFHGKNPSGRAVATGLDVITSPVQAPFWIASAVKMEASEEERAAALAKAELAEQEKKRVMALAKQWQGRFTENPSLIYDTENWRREADNRVALEYGLAWALYSQDLPFSAGIRDYIITNIPDLSYYVFWYGRTSTNDMRTYFMDNSLSYEVRKNALDSLVRNTEHMLTPEEKVMVCSHFRDKLWLMAGDKQFSRLEVETMSQAPAPAEYLKALAKHCRDYNLYSDK